MQGVCDSACVLPCTQCHPFLHFSVVLSWQRLSTCTSSPVCVENVLRGFPPLCRFHARVVLDGAACRLGDLGEVDDVPVVLGVDRVVPIVLRVLVWW